MGDQREELSPFTVSVMAWQYLGVPATSASVGRLFSIAERVYDNSRQNMVDSMLVRCARGLESQPRASDDGCRHATTFCLFIVRVREYAASLLKLDLPITLAGNIS